ncbi:MAG: hypothetical protein J2P41_11850, partial [Blastocatellia bacterium]|nr:hypothetical protein [Blastocatellia bacterium]
MIRKKAKAKSIIEESSTINLGIHYLHYRGRRENTKYTKNDETNEKIRKFSCFVNFGSSPF